MALLFMEGFEGYTNMAEALERPGTSFLVNNPDSWGIIQTGRIDGNSFELGYATGFKWKLPQISTATTWVNWADYWPTIPSATTNSRMMQVYDADGVILWSIVRNGTTQLIEVWRGTTTKLGESTTQVSTTSWVDIGAEVFVNDTTGTVKLWVNGALELNLTSQDTKPGTGTTVTYVALLNSAVQIADHRIDDFIFGDDSGADLTAYPGICHIEKLLPDGDGATTDWTPSAGSNWQNVDETPTDNDTTYNSSSTATDKDLYTFASMTGTASNVYAVQTFIRVRKEGAGFREINSTMRSSVTEVDGPDKALSVDYQWYAHIEENDPNGSGAWSVSSVNAVQAGIELKT